MNSLPVFGPDAARVRRVALELLLIVVLVAILLGCVLALVSRDVWLRQTPGAMPAGWLALCQAIILAWLIVAVLVLGLTLAFVVCQVADRRRRERLAVRAKRASAVSPDLQKLVDEAAARLAPGLAGACEP